MMIPREMWNITSTIPNSRSLQLCLRASIDHDCMEGWDIQAKGIRIRELYILYTIGGKKVEGKITSMCPTVDPTGVSPSVTT